MFNVGGGEFLVIILVALIVVGPEQLPGLLRKAGRYAAQIKSMGDNVKNEFMAGAEEMDVRKWVADDEPRRGKGTADDPILPAKSANSVAQGNASRSLNGDAEPVADPVGDESAEGSDS